LIKGLLKNIHFMDRITNLYLNKQYNSFYIEIKKILFSQCGMWFTDERILFDDVFQDTMLVIFKQNYTITENSILTLFYTIFKNNYINKLNKMSFKKELFLFDEKKQ